MAKLTHPKTGDFPFYYEDYIKLVTEEDLMTAIKNDTAMVLDFLSANKQADWDFRYAEGKWTPREILLHIIDTERIMSYRALRASRGDHTHLPGFDQTGYIENSQAAKRSLSSLVAEFKSVRNASISLFKNMTKKEAERVGYANAQQITAKSIGFVIVGHARHHFQVLREKYSFA